MNAAVKTLVDDFGRRIAEHVEAEARGRVLSAMSGLSSLTAVAEARRPGRRVPVLVIPAAARRKSPIQLCPMPGCRERAAPVFGMVCKKHRAVPKAIVRKHREARRARKAA